VSHCHLFATVLCIAVIPVMLYSEKEVNSNYVSYRTYRSN